ncbi:unnamed protein product [Caenorhabditis angaria]|uniref:Peptidase M13 C-terminal domain-containing protein n=1 Tax=Caenorhabditis angaria TaxID=860376 RepID=A0A9P1J402_9PELO|nr:unnamed protein product [Caenorhabditis angaria]
MFNQLDSIFLKAIEHNIDANVDPCDDFYRHSCDVNKPVNETLINLANEMYLAVINNLTLTDNFELGNRLEANDSSIILLKVLLDNNQTENIQKIADDFFESCTHRNKTNMKYILKTLQKTFKMMKFTNLIYDTNCRRSSEQLSKKLEKVWYDEIQSSKNSFNLSVKTNFVRSHAWMKNNINLMFEHEDYMEEFKTEIERLMKITPWVEKSDTERYFKELLEITKFSVDVYPRGEFRNFEYFNETLSECQSKYKLKSMNILCFIEHTHEFSDRINEFNAMNWVPDISFLHGMLYIYGLSNYPGLLYGASGTTLGHELGHSFVKSSHDEYFVPYFPSSFKSCVQEQFDRTCSYYKEKECRTVDSQFDENGSDIFGTKLAFDLMKKKFGDKMNEVLEGSRYNLTNAEVFFYANNFFACSREPSALLRRDSHHAPNARINAASVQVPEFQRVFGCDNNSRMMKSKTKQCILFGEDASD